MLQLNSDTIDNIKYFLSIKKDNTFNDDVKSKLLTINTDLKNQISLLITNKDIIIDQKNNVCTGELFLIHMWLIDYLIFNKVEIDNFYTVDVIKNIYTIYSTQDETIIFPMGYFYKENKDSSVAMIIDKIKINNNRVYGDFLLDNENIDSTIKILMTMYSRYIVFFSLFYNQERFFNTPSYFTMLQEQDFSILSQSIYYDLLNLTVQEDIDWLTQYNNFADSNIINFNENWQILISNYRKKLLYITINDDFLNVKEVFNESLYINFIKNILNLNALEANILILSMKQSNFYDNFMNNFVDINIDKIYNITNEKTILSKVKSIQDDKFKIWFIKNLLNNKYNMAAYNVNKNMLKDKQQKINFPNITYDNIDYTKVLSMFNDKYNIYEYITKDHRIKNMILVFIHNLFNEMSTDNGTKLIYNYLISLNDCQQLDKFYRLLEVFPYPGKIFNISEKFKDIYFQVKNLKNDNLKQWLTRELVSVHYNELAMDLNNTINDTSKKIKIADHPYTLITCLTHSLDESKTLSFVSSQPDIKFSFEIIDINGKTIINSIDFVGFFAEMKINMEQSFFVVCTHDTHFVKVV